MRFLAATAVLLLLTNTVHADRDPEFESGLVSIPIEGNQVLPGPQYQRHQLVVHDTKTLATVGTAAAIGGTLSLAAGWVVYVARQNYRLQVRTELGNAVSSWQTQGAWSLTLTGFGAANLVAAEYMLLPSSKSIPMLAWIGGLAGVGVAAVGIGFAVGSQACAPIVVAPGAEVPLACLSGTADRLFGYELLLTAAPLLNLPLTYALRSVFAGAPESLTLGPGGVLWKGRF